MLHLLSLIKQYLNDNLFQVGIQTLIIIIWKKVQLFRHEETQYMSLYLYWNNKSRVKTNTKSNFIN